MGKVKNARNFFSENLTTIKIVRWSGNLVRFTQLIILFWNMIDHLRIYSFWELILMAVIEKNMSSHKKHLKIVFSKDEK